MPPEAARPANRFLSRPAVLFLIFAGWALCLTFPLGLHFFSHIPLGSEPVATVPLFNLWTLQWNIDQLLQGYPGYWDAPIFAPLRSTFAFSESQPLTALLAAPLWLGLQSPAAGYNGVVLLFLTLNGWFAFWLMKSWLGAGRTRTTVVPLLTGLLMQSLPFVAQEMGVLQLIAIFGFLWTLLFLSRFLRQAKRGRWRKSTLLGLALGPPVTFLTCGYYGLFSFLFWPLALLFQLGAFRFSWREGEGRGEVSSSPWQGEAGRGSNGRRLAVPRSLACGAQKTFLIALLAAGLLSAGLLLPFARTQRHILSEYGFERSLATVEHNSARWQDYLRFAEHNFFYGRLLGLEAGAGQRLFPGVGLLLLAGVGLVGRGRWHLKSYLLLAILLALLLSLGLRLEPGGWQPYRWLHTWLPGFDLLRSPFRFAAFGQIHLALLAGLGLYNLQRWSSRRWLPALVAGLVLLELLAWPLPLQPLPPLQTATAWQTWLGQQPDSPNVVLLPFAASPRVGDFEQTVRWMLESRHHRARLLNGYSGFFPDHHAQLRQEMLVFPSPGSLEFLARLGAKYAVVHHARPGAPSQRDIDRQLRRVFYDSRQDVSIYEVRP